MTPATAMIYECRLDAQPDPVIPPDPEAPERKPERARSPLPRPGLAGGTAEMRGDSAPETS